MLAWIIYLESLQCKILYTSESEMKKFHLFISVKILVVFEILKQWNAYGKQFWVVAPTYAWSA